MSSGRFILASSMRLTLLSDGVPVEGVTIRRESRWWDDVVQESQTDKSGVACFESVMAPGMSMLWRIIPLEVVIRQNITVIISGRDFTLIELVKRNFQEGGEIEGVDLNFTCDLACDIMHHRMGREAKVVRARF